MGKNLVIDTLEFWYHIDNQVSYRSVTYLSGSFNKKERERERKWGRGGCISVYNICITIPTVFPSYYFSWKEIF